MPGVWKGGEVGMTITEAILTLNANVVIACERAGFHSATVKMIEDALDTIEDALKAQRPKGRWIKTPGYVTPGGDPVWRCSECGKGIHVYGIEHGTYGADVSDGQWVACPNCGALMKGEDTE